MLDERDVEDDARTLAWLARLVESDPRTKPRVLRTWLRRISEIAGGWAADLDREIDHA